MVQIDPVDDPFKHKSVSARGKSLIESVYNT